ncbi:hypothetical protein [Pseudomonas mandelii]|uniref:hypothetical protein n=1 Tax=Pseudomonas mandelii TaxID=75612 RepID=UPI0003A2D6B8|nr:hypothetical protein [Pseudomonas mandelii]
MFFLTAIPDASIGENLETHLPMPDQSMITAVVADHAAVANTEVAQGKLEIGEAVRC